MPAARAIIKQFKPSRGSVVPSHPAIAVVDFDDLCRNLSKPCKQDLTQSRKGSKDRKATEPQSNPKEMELDRKIRDRKMEPEFFQLGIPIS